MGTSTALVRNRTWAQRGPLWRGLQPAALSPRSAGIRQLFPPRWDRQDARLLPGLPSGSAGAEKPAGPLCLCPLCPPCSSLTGRPVCPRTEDVCRWEGHRAEGDGSSVLAPCWQHGSSPADTPSVHVSSVGLNPRGESEGAVPPVGGSEGVFGGRQQSN